MMGRPHMKIQAAWIQGQEGQGPKPPAPQPNNAWASYSLFLSEIAPGMCSSARPGNLTVIGNCLPAALVDLPSVFQRRCMFKLSQQRQLPMRHYWKEYISKEDGLTKGRAAESSGL